MDLTPPAVPKRCATWPLPELARFITAVSIETATSRLHFAAEFFLQLSV